MRDKMGRWRMELVEFTTNQIVPIQLPIFPKFQPKNKAIIYYLEKNHPKFPIAPLRKIQQVLRDI